MTLLVDAARQLDPVRLRTVVRHLRHVADPDGAERDAVAAFKRRGLYASPTSDEMVRVDGLLDPDTGEALLAPVNSGPPPGEDDRRTPAQRRADQLGEALRFFLAAGWAPISGGLPAQVTLTADLDTLRGERHTGALPPLTPPTAEPAATARLLGCDCQVTSFGRGFRTVLARRVECDLQRYLA